MAIHLNVRFKDRLDQCFPKTVSQFQTAIDGKSELASRGEERKLCLQQSFLNFVFAPLIIPAGATYNFIKVVMKAGLLTWRTFPLLGNYEQNINLWKRDAHRLVDHSVATLLFPLQPITKAARLALGVIHPSFVFKKREKLLVRRQLKRLHYDLRKRIGALPKENDLKRLAHRILFYALLDYSYRWQLTQTIVKKWGSRDLQGHSVGYWRTKKELARVKDDTTQQKADLFKTFVDTLEGLEAGKESKKLLKDLFQQFQTEKQKAVLHNFAKKVDGRGISNIINNSSQSSELCSLKDGALEKLKERIRKILTGIKTQVAT